MNSASIDNEAHVGLCTTVAQRDFAVEAVELTGGKVESACGVAFFIAMMSALHDRPVQPAMVILGDADRALRRALAS